MKTIKKTLLQIGLFVLAVICACLCFWVVPMPQTSASAAGNAVENVYIGTSFEAQEYTMQSVGGDAKAEGMRIVYPNGDICGSTKFTVEQAGKYQVTYYASVDGARVEETKTYMAIRRPQDMVVTSHSTMNVGFGRFFVNGAPFEHKTSMYGVKVTMKAGQSIRFATNLKTKDLTADFNFLEMLAEPSIYGETDFERLTVRLTDANNEMNYIEYVIASSDMLDGAGQISYVRAGAVNRRYGGWEGTYFHTRTHYGTSVDHSFRGLGCLNSDRNQLTISELPLTLAVDHATKAVYCGPRSSTVHTNSLVNDLDDEEHYKSDPWEGFESDEVYVTVTADKFMKGEGVLFIKSYAGYDFSKDVVDKTAPEIDFAYDMNAVMPVAEVGSRFQMIPFSVRDNLDHQIKQNVFVNYVDEDGKKITVENDGASFFVEYPGKYEVIYRAEDCSGNVNEQCVEIEAKPKTPNIYVGVQQPIIEQEVYEFVDVPYASDVYAYGGSGVLQVERAVYSPSKKLLNVTDKMELTEVGDYKIVYTAEDYYGNVGYGVVTVRSQATSAPKFIKQPKFTQKLLSGFIYDFPKAFAVETVGSTLLVMEFDTYVNGELMQGSFLASGEEMTIRYVANGQTGSLEWEETIEVVNTERGRYKSEYFYTVDAIDFVDEKTHVELVVLDNAKATFLNALNSENFSLTFEYAAENIHFEEMQFILTDAVDQTRSVTFRLVYSVGLGQWYLYINDIYEPIAFTASKGILTFTYSPQGKKILDTSGDAIAVVPTYSSGKVFEGFSPLVYFDIAFVGVQAESSLSLMQIANQSMGYNKSSIEKAKDETSPIIVLDDVFLLRQPLGSKAAIPTARAYDVLNSIKVFTVSVELGGRLIASGSAQEPIDLMLDKPGYYSVTYFAEDTNGNTASLPFMILVEDTIAPTITVKNTLKETYKVGDKITIPTYSATDNEENCFIQVMVLLPDNEMRLLHYVANGEVTSLLSKESSVFETEFKAGLNVFVTQKKGKYVLRFVAYDDYYNYTIKEIEFWVE